jgi:hypothetical protein
MLSLFIYYKFMDEELTGSLNTCGYRFGWARVAVQRSTFNHPATDKQSTKSHVLPAIG